VTRIQILIWISSELPQAGRMTEEVFLPLMHVTARRILASDLHSANGIDNSPACRRELAWPLATSVISLVPHSLNLAHVNRG